MIFLLVWYNIWLEMENGSWQLQMTFWPYCHTLCSPILEKEKASSPLPANVVWRTKEDMIQGVQNTFCKVKYQKNLATGWLNTFSYTIQGVKYNIFLGKVKCLSTGWYITLSSSYILFKKLKMKFAATFFIEKIFFLLKKVFWRIWKKFLFLFSIDSKLSIPGFSFQHQAHTTCFI